MCSTPKGSDTAVQTRDGVRNSCARGWTCLSRSPRSPVRAYLAGAVDRAVRFSGLSRWVARLRRSGGRVEQLRPPVGRFEIEAEFQLALNDGPEFVETWMRIGEHVDRGPGLDELLVSMHLLHGLLQGLDLLVQRPDLLTGRLLLVAHLELAELVRGLAEDVIRDVAQADLLAVGGAQVQIIDDHVQPRDWVRAQLLLHADIVR